MCEADGCRWRYPQKNNPWLLINSKILMLIVPKGIKNQKIIILEFIETKQNKKNMWLLNRDQPSLH